MDWDPCRKMVNVCRGVNRRLQENVPNGGTVELNFGHSRIPIFIQDRGDVKNRQYTNDGEVQRPES